MRIAVNFTLIRPILILLLFLSFSANGADLNINGVKIGEVIRNYEDGGQLLKRGPQHYIYWYPGLDQNGGVLNQINRLPKFGEKPFGGLTGSGGFFASGHGGMHKVSEMSSFQFGSRSATGYQDACQHKGVSLGDMRSVFSGCNSYGNAKQYSKGFNLTMEMDGNLPRPMSILTYAPDQPGLLYGHQYHDRFDVNYTPGNRNPDLFNFSRRSSGADCARGSTRTASPTSIINYDNLCPNGKSSCNRNPNYSGAVLPFVQPLGELGSKAAEAAGFDEAAPYIGTGTAVTAVTFEVYLASGAGAAGIGFLQWLGLAAEGAGGIWLLPAVAAAGLLTFTLGAGLSGWSGVGRIPHLNEGYVGPGYYKTNEGNFRYHNSRNSVRCY